MAFCCDEEESRAVVEGLRESMGISTRLGDEKIVIGIGVIPYST
jgi:hypothetical protein